MTTYGTTTNGSAVAVPNGATGGDEEQPLLRSSKPKPRSVVSKLRKQMTAEVSRSWADVVLLLCYVVTGLLDSASTQVWGAFVSMQTGMLLFLMAAYGISSRAWFFAATRKKNRIKEEKKVVRLGTDHHIH